MVTLSRRQPQLCFIGDLILYFIHNALTALTAVKAMYLIIVETQFPKHWDIILHMMLKHHNSII